RIQQIVNASGGSWWRKTWRTRGASPDAVCTWCQRPPSEVNKLVAGPKVFICDRCVEDAWRRVARARRSHAAEHSRARCSFCSRKGSDGRTVLADPSANVCDECLKMCRDFMALDPA